MPTYKLSILLISFNHEKYIHRAMRSILDQALEGPIELVVADDGSSDQTREIIRSYENIDSRFHFKYLDYFPNRGVTKNYQRGFAACGGRYVAIMEGDDYWCSPLKLQRQCDFLDVQWQCDLCSVNYYVYEERRGQFTPRTAARNGHRFISSHELIADNIVGNFSTCMYRKSALDALPTQLFEIKSYDWIVNICIARQSLIGFIEDPMSVYRLHANGVWSQSTHVEKLRLQLGVIPAYDKLTEHMFKAEFDDLAGRLKHAIAASQVTHATEILAQPVTRLMPRILDFTPPILVVIARSLTPPVLKRILVKLLVRGRSA